MSPLQDNPTGCLGGNLSEDADCHQAWWVGMPPGTATDQCCGLSNGEKGTPLGGPLGGCSEIMLTGAEQLFLLCRLGRRSRSSLEQSRFQE